MYYLNDWFRRWFWSTNHKDIGTLYLIFGGFRIITTFILLFFFIFNHSYLSCESVLQANELEESQIFFLEDLDEDSKEENLSWEQFLILVLNNLLNGIGILVWVFKFLDYF